MRAVGEGLSRVVTPLPGAGDKDGTLSSKLLLFVKCLPNTFSCCCTSAREVCRMLVGSVLPSGTLDRSKRVSHARADPWAAAGC